MKEERSKYFPFMFLGGEIMIEEKALRKCKSLSSYRDNFIYSYSNYIEEKKCNGIFEKYVKFQIQERLLVPSDIEAIFINEISQKETDLFIPSTYEEVEKSINSGWSRCFTYDGKIVAYGLAFSDFWGSLYLEKYYVLPDFRGWKFQYLTRKILIEQCKVLDYSNLKTFVSPDNLRSIKNLKDLGFKTAKLTKFHNKKRKLMICELR